jgi:hypothetical protein
MDKIPSNINVGRTGRLGDIVDSQTPERKVVHQVAGVSAVLVLVCLYPVISDNSILINLFAILVGIAVCISIRASELFRRSRKKTAVILVIATLLAIIAAHLLRYLYLQSERDEPLWSLGSFLS